MSNKGLHFTGFQSIDFETFELEGLELRMQAIRQRIQPKFHALAEDLLDEVSMIAGHEMYVHVAKHLRRKVNAPKDTWMAFCHNKRGYKQHPHFQIGLYDDRVFIWFALIYEAPNKKAIAQKLIKQKSLFTNIPDHYVLSVDHTQKEAIPFHTLTWKQISTSLERFRDIGHAEFLVGRHFRFDHPDLQSGSAFITEVKDTLEKLSPLYKESMS